VVEADDSRLAAANGYAQTTPTANSASTARQLVISSQRSTNSVFADSSKIPAFMGLSSGHFPY
jgi:hypothetical protein